MKKLLFLASLLFSLSANAGLGHALIGGTIGYMVGSNNSSNKTIQSLPPIVTKKSTVTCEQPYSRPLSCVNYPKTVSVGRFVKLSGFNFYGKIYQQIVGDHIYNVIEVFN